MSQGRIQKVWLGGNGGSWGLGAEVESSAVGARIEAPMGWGVKTGPPLHRGKGLGRQLCLLPRKLFDF